MEVGNLGTSAWLDGGGERPLGGEGRRTPVAVGAVMTDREKALKAMEVLKTVLGESAGNSREELVREQIPPAAEPVPPASPTEYQRVLRLGTLLNQETQLKKGLEEGRERVEKAKAKVLEEEERVTKVEKDLSEVRKQMDAHRAEDKKRERKRRAEAREARGPKVEEVISDMEVTEDGGDGDSTGEGGVFQEVGKKRKRKVVRSFAKDVGGFGDVDLDEVVEVLKKPTEQDRTFA